MLELTLFILLGVLCWEHFRSKNKIEKRWTDVANRLQRLDSELKSKKARWSEIKSNVELLGHELEKLRNQIASLEKPAPIQASQPSAFHEAPLPSPAQPAAMTEPVAPPKPEASVVALITPPAEPKLSSVPLTPPVAFPSAAAVPPLSGASLERLGEGTRPVAGQPVKPPQLLPTTTPVHPVSHALSPVPGNVKASLTSEILKISEGPARVASPAAGTVHPPSLPLPRFTVQPPPGPPMSARLKRLLNLEELLGTNYLIKIGVVVLVIGVGGFIFSNLDKIPTWLQLFAAFLVGLAMLISGIWYEPGKYRLLARAGMGGGWAVIFITTWGLHHAGKHPLVSSEPADFVFLMIVATAMVLHTLRYNSQLLSGFAFLLPSLTVTVTLGFASDVANTVRIPGLVGTAVLALGLVAIVVCRQWFEMEVYGIVVTYLNHFFWIRPIIQHGSPTERAATFFGSAVLLVAYWAIFRASYIVRKVDNATEETISSVAALLNTFMLIGLLKYQAAHPELAFWCLLALGAVELTLGQLPITRRRRAAFTILTTMGVIFLAAALPFKFSGAALSIILLAEAEVFFLVGVFTREIVFRRLGMLAGLLVVVDREWLASVQISKPGFNGLAAHDVLKAVMVYGLPTLIFYANSHWVPRRWPELVQTELEDWSCRSYSYLAGSVAFVGFWLICPQLWLTVAWGAFALALAILGEQVKIPQLSKQVPFFTVAAAMGTTFVNLSFLERSHGLSLRLVTVSLAAALFYLIANWERRAEIADA